MRLRASAWKDEVRMHPRHVSTPTIDLPSRDATTDYALSHPRAILVSNEQHPDSPQVHSDCTLSPRLCLRPNQRKPPSGDPAHVPEGPENEKFATPQSNPKRKTRNPIRSHTRIPLIACPELVEGHRDFARLSRNLWAAQPAAPRAGRQARPYFMRRRRMRWRARA